MDWLQQTTHNIGDAGRGRCRVKLVDFEIHENHISHETQGLSTKHLVVRRGRPFKLTLRFRGRPWNPRDERLVLEVWLGGLSARIPVQSCRTRLNPQHWSAEIYAGGPSTQGPHPESVTLRICSPVVSSVAAYDLLVHVETRRDRTSCAVGSFVLLCNPWLENDPVYMPHAGQIQEYVKSDYGLVFMGTSHNVCQRPWSFGQYEPGVLEACLKLLEVSPQHLSDKTNDYLLRADPVYLCRVICAMVNCNDDLGILMGKWQGGYEDGVEPTEWSGSADILRRWASSNFRPVRYGQCWVFASVLCTVMRVLGIPSRVVTVFNAAHDGNANLKIEEYYSSTGEKLNLSKDSVWNFHVWVECWMRRPDLGAGFDGWQVVDATPQEKSAGVFCCGPCPVVAVRRRRLEAPHDAPFIFASVDADVVRLIVRKGLVVGRTVDTERVGQLIYTKSIGSAAPEDLTLNYKSRKGGRKAFGGARTEQYSVGLLAGAVVERHAASPGETSPGLAVSLKVNGKPSAGESVGLSVTVTNRTSRPRLLEEHVNAQLKGFNSNPQESFWTSHKEVHVKPHQALTLEHAIPSSEYESLLAADDIVNLAVVIKDVRTNERVLETQEFNIASPQITIEIEGGDSVQVKKERAVRLSFTNTLTKALHEAVLTVEGSGLLSGRQEARLALLKPGEKLEKEVSIMAASPGTKVLMAMLSHRDCASIVSRSFRKVSVASARY